MHIYTIILYLTCLRSIGLNAFFHTGTYYFNRSTMFLLRRFFVLTPVSFPDTGQRKLLTFSSAVSVIVALFDVSFFLVFDFVQFLCGYVHHEQIYRLYRTDSLNNYRGISAL